MAHFQYFHFSSINMTFVKHFMKKLYFAHTILVKSQFKVGNMKIKPTLSGLEIIIFQWSDMLSDYARIDVGYFSF